MRVKTGNDATANDIPTKEIGKYCKLLAKLKIVIVPEAKKEPKIVITIRFT